MPQLIGILLVIGAALYLLGYVIVSIIISSIATIGSVIIIAVGSYFLRESVVNKVSNDQANLLDSLNYSNYIIDRHKSKINLYAFFAVIYSLFIMFEGLFFHEYFISELKYNLGIYENLNNDTYNYDYLVFGGLIVCAIVIYSFTVFIKKKFTNWVISGIEKKIKKNPPIQPKPKPKKQNSNTQNKPNTTINPSQYGVNSNMSKQEIKKVLNREFQKWHNASRSPDAEIEKKARIHKKNIAILRKELL